MRHRKVFVIEDNKTEAMVMRLAFSGLKNVSVEYFEKGYDLLENLHHCPSFIILDMMLPDINGLELIKKVKTYDPTIEIIVVSAQEDLGVVSKTQDEGVFNYVVKSESCLIYLKKTIENLAAMLECRESRVGLKGNTETR